MLISVSWLKDYVQIPVTLDELVEDLTMAGLNVEHVEQRGLSVEGLVVGKVLEAGRHPNADRLSVCRVQTGGDDVRDIVCGAPNVAAGQFVAVALPGATLPNGVTIKRTKIRGIESQGMICSEIELGIGDDAAGIIVLDDEYEIGTPAANVLVEPDQILEIEVTPNRSDLLSHIGVAREVAAIYKVPVQMPLDAAGITKATERGRHDVKIEIEDANDCARYVGKRVSGVRVGPSPEWLAKKLEAVGVQSINNVVDVANYVMMELGQPLHAFDFTRLSGGLIKTRRAVRGERLLALDGTTYELDPGVLVIADDKEPVALAGIIGGEESAVHADTTEILIESANFHPTVVRKGRKTLAISTEASYRFERGVDRELCRLAAERAAQLLCDLGGGTLGPAVDDYPSPHEPLTIRIRAANTRRILGAVLSTDEIAGILERLGFTIGDRTDDSVTVRVPPYRLDVMEEIDLIEEVARLHGFDRIGTGWGFRCTTFAQVDEFDRFIDEVGDYLTARGFSEVVGSAFTDGRELEDFGWSDDDPRSKPMPIRNPLNVNHKYLRTSLVPGMLDVIRRNMDHEAKRIKFYQVGRIFLAPEGPTQLPEERTILALAMSRPESVDFWYGSKSAMDLFDIRGELDALLAAFGVDLDTGVWYDFDRTTGAFAYSTKEEALLDGGVVTDRVALRHDFDQPVWHASIDLTRCFELRSRQRKLEALPEYPVSKRDLSLVSPLGVEFREIEKALVKHSGPLLESLVVFDVYRGEKIAKDHTAYGVRMNFRAPDRTLRDEEIDRVIDKVVTKLKNEIGVELRS